MSNPGKISSSKTDLISFEIDKPCFRSDALSSLESEGLLLDKKLLILFSMLIQKLYNRIKI